MIADQKIFKPDINSIFSANFNPLAANANIHGNMGNNPFKTDMSAEFSPGSQFSMKTESKSFVP